MNSLVRFKLALTEDAPTIRTYEEADWANLIDGCEDDLTDSLDLLTALHRKWARLLNNMSPADMSRTYIHPDLLEPSKLERGIGV